MSERDRLAQRLMVGVDPDEPSRAAELVRRTRVGGIFVGGDSTAMLDHATLGDVRSSSPNPVAVAVDDEGGRVQRIDALAGDLPSARSMGALPTDEVRALARERGRALTSAGVTIDFAPVLDLGGRPADDVIGDRAFASDPDGVTRAAGAFADGLRSAGVVPVFKHFPGHGRASGDSHRGTVRTPPLAALREADLVPFERLTGRGEVMVGHLVVPGLTGSEPASLSPAAYRLLRSTGFDGVAFTDDLAGMRAITDRHAPPDAAVRALAAGADVALLSSAAPGIRIDTAAVDTVLDRLQDALASGELDDAANIDSVVRILRMNGAC